MKNSSLLLTNGDNFIVEIKKCEKSGEEYAICYYESQKTLECCTQTVVCRGGSITLTCKTCAVDVDCTGTTPTGICKDGVCLNDWHPSQKKA